jgi:multiple sugar transport system substrate-binding protein
MKKSIFALAVLLVLVSSIVFAGGQKGGGEGTSSVAASSGPFGLGSIPPIKNKASIHIALETAAGTASSLIPAINRFQEKTGIKVTYEELVMSAVYPKVNLDFLSATGAYDIIVCESSTTNEWAEYLIPVKELAAKWDNGGVASLERDLAGIEPVILRTASDRNGVLRGIPYYTFEMVMYIRQDVLDDPTEKANFKKKYGYDLKAPTTDKEIQDFGEFFTRKKGEPLKGVPLTEDIYALGLMAGQYEINDEISARIWGNGGHWATTIRDKSGKAIEFVITKNDQAAIRKALETYKSDLKYASPACLSGFWDYTTAQFVAGKTLCLPSTWSSLDQWAFQVEDQIPGAEMAYYPVVGGKGYTGCYHQAVSKFSKNPEAAYWLIRYLGSFEAQKEMMESTGWNGVRRDILDDAKYQVPQWRRLIGEKAKILTSIWDTRRNEINDIFHFNSAAMGKIYEMQIVVCHQTVAGDITIDEGVRQIITQTVDLQKKFGQLPIRVE